MTSGYPSQWRCSPDIKGIAILFSCDVFQELDKGNRTISATPRPPVTSRPPTEPEWRVLQGSDAVTPRCHSSGFYFLKLTKLRNVSMLVISFIVP
ncbi:hypothetical protein RRG08_045142 [Elysia crispata]|uniref:Uncharacterized protein n=1 Tax=Elysia crispata TaxID=231223 RepID=A0AAE1D426_9GAST|nr:hypothetical protein RRG08_045142 [Elysia crispata]